MPITPSTELYWLVMTVSLTAVMWLPYIINRMAEQGILPALWDPFGHTEAKAAWANRMMRAHENAVENLVIFAPLVLVVHLTGQGTVLTVNACVIYFVTRLVHYLGFTFAVPLVRVVSFLAGFLCPNGAGANGVASTIACHTSCFCAREPHGGG